MAETSHLLLLALHEIQELGLQEATFRGIPLCTLGYWYVLYVLLVLSRKGVLQAQFLFPNIILSPYNIHVFLQSQYLC